MKGTGFSLKLILPKIFLESKMEKRWSFWTWWSIQINMLKYIIERDAKSALLKKSNEMCEKNILCPKAFILYFLRKHKRSLNNKS